MRGLIASSKRILDNVELEESGDEIENTFVQYQPTASEVTLYEEFRLLNSKDIYDPYIRVNVNRLNIDSIVNKFILETVTLKTVTPSYFISSNEFTYFHMTNPKLATMKYDGEMISFFTKRNAKWKNSEMLSRLINSVNIQPFVSNVFINTRNKHLAITATTMSVGEMQLMRKCFSKKFHIVHLNLQKFERIYNQTELIIKSENHWSYVKSEYIVRARIIGLRTTTISPMFIVALMNNNNTEQECGCVPVSDSFEIEILMSQPGSLREKDYMFHVSEYTASISFRDYDGVTFMDAQCVAISRDVKRKIDSIESFWPLR